MWWVFFVSGSFSVLFFSLFFLLSWFFFLILWEKISILFTWEIYSSFGCVFDFSLVFDWISVSFGCVVLLISACVMLFSCEYMAEDKFLPRFSWLVFLFVLSMSFVIFIPNFVAILIGWDGLGLVSFLLVIYYQNFKSLAGGMVTVLMNRIGDVMILLSIGLLCSEGSFSFFFLSVDSGFWVVCLMLLVAGMTKSAQIPFSSWLPAAMAAPTPVSALVHSSTLVTAGVFLLIRFFYYLDKMWWFGPVLFFVSTITMLMAGIAANMENDLKKIIALSTLSQLGVMMAALGVGAWKLALFHLYTHAMFKALLFLCAGAFIHRSQNSQDLRFSGNVWSRVPVTVSCLHVSNLALCGAPFMAGFYSKDMILETILFGDTSLIILFMILLATGLTASYSVRLSFSVLWGTFNFYSCHNWSDEKLCEVVPMMFLMAGAVVGGSFFMWFLFYGEGLCFLGSVNKFLVLIIIVAGGVCGWWMKSFKGVYEEKKFVFFSKSFYGFTYMWFLVQLSSQGVAKDSLKVGSFVLVQGDRGWFEFLGGQGSFSLIKKIICFGQELSFNSVAIYMSIVFFTLGCFFCLTFLV
uniref:NADH-ubiquinone oxidoreductase chain 5 n=1 Tax=Lineus viridis TaxID=56195 RepID=C6GCT2_9BILA|nr:NADH dehydrogenase subunit 5 [Lineus viridis]ACO40322.1 NADH dehydrogenase subunit 5 [Lineus viridis]